MSLTRHHAPVRCENDLWSLAQLLKKTRTDSDTYAHTFLALNRGDAHELMEALGKFVQARPDVQTMVLYGHRHGRFFGKTLSGVTVIEAPAVVESTPGFWVGEETEKGLQIFWDELGSVMAQQSP